MTASLPENRLLLLRAIGSRSWSVEGDKLLVSRGEGVVRCVIFATMGDATGSMAWAGPGPIVFLITIVPKMHKICSQSQ